MFGLYLCALCDYVPSSCPTPCAATAAFCQSTDDLQRGAQGEPVCLALICVHSVIKSSPPVPLPVLPPGSGIKQKKETGSRSLGEPESGSTSLCVTQLEPEFRCVNRKRLRRKKIPQMPCAVCAFFNACIECIVSMSMCARQFTCCKRTGPCMPGGRQLPQ